MNETNGKPQTSFCFMPADLWLSAISLVRRGWNKIEEEY